MDVMLSILMRRFGCALSFSGEYFQTLFWVNNIRKKDVNSFKQGPLQCKCLNDVTYEQHVETSTDLFVDSHEAYSLENE